MRKEWILAGFPLSAVSLVPASLFAQDQAPPIRVRSKKADPWKAVSNSLRRERSEVRGDRNNVVLGKVRNHFLH